VTAGGPDIRPSRDIPVVDLTAGDVAEIARVHVLAQPDSELGRYGPEVVRRSYLWQFEGPHDLTAIGVRRDGELQGFLIGGVFRGSTTGFVKREWRFLVGQVLRHPSALLHPGARSRMVLAGRLLLGRGAPSAPDPASAVDRSFGVLAIAVDPAARGQGLGRAIMDAAEQTARAEGYDQMHLTVEPANGHALAFYERGGWQPWTPEGEPWTGFMVKPLR